MGEEWGGTGRGGEEEGREREGMEEGRGKVTEGIGENDFFNEPTPICPTRDVADMNLRRADFSAGFCRPTNRPV